MKAESNEQLLPCPFCGENEPILLRPEIVVPPLLETIRGYAWMCGGCGCRTVKCETEDDANAQWNRRTCTASWTAIHSEADLPHIPGFYLWWYREEEHTEAETIFFDEGMNLSEWVKMCAAWMPIPPYQPKTAKENDDER